MRLNVYTLLFAVLMLTPFSNGQVSLEMEPIEAKSTITDVTLYRNRAAITRTATLDLSVGGYSVYFRDLPNAASADSVQARVGETVSLLSVDTSNKPTVTDSALIKEITAEIDAVQEKIDNANAREDSIELQITMVKTLIDQARNENAGPVDLEALDKQLEFIGSKMTTLVVLQTKISYGLTELKRELQTLRIRRQNLTPGRRTQLDAIVDIAVKQAGTVQVQLTYLVNNATWIPTYSIRANNAGDEITVEYDAELTQRSGENWANVNMTLSTAQPQQSTTPPMPTPWFVDIYQPPPASPKTEANKRGGSRSFYGELAEDSIALGAEVVMEASASATVNNEGPAVSFTLPRTITVPSNSEDVQTASLGAFETKAEMFHIAVPMWTDSTFIRSNVTNTSDFILLPGQASIFHGSDYVGKTTLPTIAPNETFPLDLGIDPVVTATRVLLEKETASTGLFASGKQTIYDYRITISNGNDKAIDIHVWDRIPVSRNEEIIVALENLSAPLSTDQSYIEVDLPQGLLRWDLSIPASLTGDNSFVLNWKVEIARGNDIEMTPLPE